jgi:hypothetical protein
MIYTKTTTTRNLRRKFLFIDGEMYDSPHLAKCLCNFFVHMHCWVENPTETMVYQQLHMRLMLFQSQGGKLWLEYTKMSHKHIFHSLMMDIQSVIHAVSSTMIGNTTWIDHVDDGNEILAEDSLDLVEHCSRFGMQALHTALAGNNGPFDTPPITFSWFECPQIRQRGLWLGNVPPKHHQLDNQISGQPQATTDQVDWHQEEIESHQSGTTAVTRDECNLGTHATVR